MLEFDGLKDAIKHGVKEALWELDTYLKQIITEAVLVAVKESGPEILKNSIKDAAFESADEAKIQMQENADLLKEVENLRQVIEDKNAELDELTAEPPAKEEKAPVKKPVKKQGAAAEKK